MVYRESVSEWWFDALAASEVNFFSLNNGKKKGKETENKKAVGRSQTIME